jgi:hypothetical protein
MDDAKYVIIDGCKPVIFSGANQHSDFRSVGDITSAGFVSIEEVDTPEGSRIYTVKMFKAHCFGESVSLKMKPSDFDEYLIERLLNPY